MIGDHIIWPPAACCSPSYPGGCVCPPMEKALRGWQREDCAVPGMTPEQRDFCLDEIGRIEGHRREDHEADNDADLARGVLDAWTDFARDKGLL